MRPPKPRASGGGAPMTTPASTAGTLQRVQLSDPAHRPTEPLRSRVAYAAAHVVADPRAENVPGAPAASTGTRPSPSATTSGPTGWAWPRRWTPPSAAWGWTGRPPAS